MKPRTVLFAALFAAGCSASGPIGILDSLQVTSSGGVLALATLNEVVGFDQQHKTTSTALALAADGRVEWRTSGDDATEVGTGQYQVWDAGEVRVLDDRGAVLSRMPATGAAPTPPSSGFSLGKAQLTLGGGDQLTVTTNADSPDFVAHHVDLARQTASGATVWQRSVTGTAATAIAHRDDALFLALYDSAGASVAKLSVTDGTTVWQTPLR